MKYVFALLTAIIQYIVGYLFVFFGAWVGMSLLVEALGLVGPDYVNPWWSTPFQFISIALFASLGVWIVGWLAAKLRKLAADNRKAWWATLAGSALGIVFVSVIYNFQPALGFLPIWFSLFGAILGNILQPYIWK